MTDRQRRSDQDFSDAGNVTAARLIEVSDSPALLIDVEGRVLHANGTGQRVGRLS